MTMKTTLKYRGPKSAFTLLEVVIVFVLIIVITGAGVLSLNTVSAEKKIVKPANSTKSMAREALRLAIKNRHSYAISLKEDSVTLRKGTGTVTEQDQQDPSFAPLFGEEEAEDTSGVVDSLELGDDLRLEVRRWNEKYFREPEGDVWVFEPSGICEPLAIKLIHKNGYIEMEFNPLTAKIQDQSLIIDSEAVENF